MITTLGSLAPFTQSCGRMELASATEVAGVMAGMAETAVFSSPVVVLAAASAGAVLLLLVATADGSVVWLHAANSKHINII